jgi:Protein of unknown function (DUF1566)
MKIEQIFTVLFFIVITSFVHAACPSLPGRFVPVAAIPSEVLDTKTQLVWARCSVGQTWNGSTYAATQTGWRLPNIKELFSLADRGCETPAIDRSIFPNTNSVWYGNFYNPYWSSTPLLTTAPAHANSAWVLRQYGGSDTQSRSFSAFVRLVKSN